MHSPLRWEGRHQVQVDHGLAPPFTAEKWQSWSWSAQPSSYRFGYLGPPQMWGRKGSKNPCQTVHILKHPLPQTKIQCWKQDFGKIE